VKAGRQLLLPVGLRDDGLTPGQAARRLSILAALDALQAAASGFVVEPKPRSVAFHYRNADPAAAEFAVREVRELAAGLDDVTVKEGKMVVELAVTEGDKGAAIRRLARSIGADAIIYIGDDVTDEDAFAVLGGSDLGIKVLVLAYRLHPSAQLDDTCRHRARRIGERFDHGEMVLARKRLVTGFRLALPRLRHRLALAQELRRLGAADHRIEHTAERDRPQHRR
jgi:hypothetical protein